MEEEYLAIRSTTKSLRRSPPHHYTPSDPRQRDHMMATSGEVSQLEVSSSGPLHWLHPSPWSVSLQNNTNINDTQHDLTHLGNMNMDSKQKKDQLVSETCDTKRRPNCTQIMVFARSQEYNITLFQHIRMTYGLAVQGGNGNNGDPQLKQHTEHYGSNLIPPRVTLEKILQVCNERKRTGLSEGTPGLCC